MRLSKSLLSSRVIANEPEFGPAALAAGIAMDVAKTSINTAKL